jgi:hypothetical protein
MGESGSYGGSDTNNAGRMLEDFPEGMTVVFVFRGHDVSFLCSGFGNVETVQAASKKNLAFAAQVRRFRPDAALRSGGHGGGRKARRQIFARVLFQDGALKIAGSQPVPASSRSARAASSDFFIFAHAGAVAPFPSASAASIPLLPTRLK